MTNRGQKIGARRLMFVSIALLGAGVLGACEGGGGSPPPAPVLSSISVTPAASTAPRGTTQQFTAIGSYSDGGSRDLTTTATWVSSDASVATINASGLAIAANRGTATVSATSAGVTGSTSFTVAAAALVSLAVTPGNATLGFLGATQQFRATGTYTDQSTAELTNEVAWSSSNAAVVAIGPDGFASATASTGSSNVSARSGNAAASATVNLRTATVSGQVSFPASDMGWKPSIHDLLASGGGKVHVMGTSLSADVVPTSATTGTFTLTGVPWGPVTLSFDEGASYDVFTQASKRLELSIGSDTVSGASFTFVYHWRELAGYPPPWGSMQSQGPVSWKAQFLSEDVAFIAFRMDIPSERIELHRTVDRGASWMRVGQWIFDQAAWNTATWPYPGHWDNFYFLDRDHGVMHATAFGIPCDSGGGYFQTGDGGQTWTVRPLPMTPTGYHVLTNGYARIGASHIVMAGTVGCGVQGYSAGFYDAIWESTNAGVDWSLRWSSARDSSGAFVGLDANSIGRAVAFRGGSIQQFLLRDAQGNWSSGAASGIVSTSRDIAMVDDSAWIVSTAGTANGTYRSGDAGANWGKLSGGLPQDFDFVTPLKGFAQAGGPAYATYDGGVTWRYQSAGGAVWPGVMDVWAFDRTHAAWAEVGFGDPNQKGQLFTYVEPAQASIELLARPAGSDASVSRGSPGVLMSAYDLRSNGPVPVSVQSVTLHGSGSGNDATGIAAVKLWLDRNGDGAVDAGDTLLASGSFGADDGNVTLASDAVGPLEQFQSVTLLVTCDLAATGSYSGSFRLTAGAADVSAREAPGGAPVMASAPAGFALTSRTITVRP